MEFEDDLQVQSFSPLHESSSQFQPRRLKRLKKRKDNDDDAVQFPQSSNRLSNKSTVDDDDDLILFPKVDFAKLQALEAGLYDSNSDDSNPPLHPSPIRETGSVEEKLENAKEDSIVFDGEFLISVEAQRDAKRDLDFDEVADLENPDPEPGLIIEEEEEKNTEKKGKKRIKTESAKVVKGGNKKLENAKEDSIGFDDEFSNSVEARRDAKRVLDFDGVADLENPDRIIEEEEEKNTEKGKKRIKTESVKVVKGGNRKLEKVVLKSERKDYLHQLHAESQRLLRESTDAAFKPTPVGGKSICDVLEKIRQRKMQVTKKTMISYNASSVPNNVNCFRDALEAEVEEEIEIKREAVVKSVDQLLDTAPKQPEVSQVDQQSADHFDVDASIKSAKLSSCDNIPIEKDPDEKPTPLLRPPIDDTQDLFGDSETRDDEVEPLSGLEDSPLEEPFVPSLNALNLKFDSVLSDDSSSEEDDDKENVGPQLQRYEDSPRRGDPVKAFLDEEAEEEDDSDHDMLRFPENEDDDIDDFEELNDIIATDFEEKPSDNERRNELHQKWLEQQDAAGTDNLLQKFKVGLNQQEYNLTGEEDENEDIEEDNTEEENDMPPKTSARANLKKAKEMIVQMFVEKDELYVSDEDEEMEKKLFKHRRDVKTEGLGLSVSSVQDKSLVSGLIKNLNIAPESRKKPKITSYFDSVLKGGNDNGFAKSSFVGRSSNHALPPTHKKSAGPVRAYIFGRDDSNSRNSVTASDDSEDAMLKGNHTIGTTRAPPTRSHQAKFSSQSKKVTTEAVVVAASRTNLFEALRRSSMKTGCINPEDRIDLTQIISTFKIPTSRIPK